MKARRVLAAVLCAAVFFSSEAFTMGVAASESSDPAVTEAVIVEAEQPDEETPEETIEPTETPVQEAIPSVTPEATEEPAVPEETAVPAVTATPEVSTSPEASMTPQVSATPSASELPTDSATPEASMTPSPAVMPTPSVTPGLDDGIQILGSGDFLGVDEDGKLILTGSVYGTAVTIPKEAKIIPEGIFNEYVSISQVKFEEDSMLETIEAGAFEDSRVTEIEIPKGVTRIESETFKNSALEKITFLGKVEYIGEEAFNASKLTTISAPNVTEIGDEAFADCSFLSSVKMANLEIIGAQAFKNCEKLGSGMTWGAKLNTIKKEAFKNCGFYTLNLSGISGDITIAISAFENCRKLDSVTLPSQLKNIAASVFKGCTKLKTVTIGEQVETIGEAAFSGCTSLSRILLPVSVSKILSKAFDGCELLEEVIIHYPTPADDEFTIAQDAFPIKKGVVMKGYGGKVEDYAEKRGYEYETLFTRYNIVYVASDHGKVTVNKNPVVPGEEVLVNVTPNTGYCLNRAGVWAESTAGMVKVRLASCTEEKQVFSFIMPAGNVELKFNFVPVAEAVKGNIGYDFEAVNGYTGEYDGKQLVMDKTGRETGLIVNIDGEPLGAWLVNFKSDDTSKVIVSDTGIIRAQGEGSANVTATLKSDSSKKVTIKVKVGGLAVIDKLSVDVGKPDRAQIKSTEINGKEYPVVEYNKATIASGNRSFKVSVKATEANEDNNLIVSSAWTAVDKSIASVAASTSSDNTNTITVKKGVEGETFITVSVKNKGVEEPIETGFIVRVVDATPRLADSKININSLSEDGTAIDIVTVYGYDINTEKDLQICEKDVDNGITEYDPVEGFKITEYNGQYRIKATSELELGSGKSKTYKNKLYITGEFDETGESFVIPVTELTVVNKALKPAVKTTGKINLFYNSRAAEQGSVKVTQSLTNEKVERYELVSEANHKKKGSEAEDTFAANFQIEKQADGSGLITRTENDMVQVKGKNVVSGYLYIYYEGYNIDKDKDGYRDPDFAKKITISTTNSAPSYVLSMTSATANTNRSNQVYELQLLESKNKKNVVDLSNLARGNGLTFDYSGSGTTKELFKDLEADDDKNCILLKVDGYPTKGKAVINVKMDTWSKPLKYTFKLGVTSGAPKVTLSSGTVTLNTICASQGAAMQAKLNQIDTIMEGFDESSLAYSGNAKTASEADKIDITFGTDSITAKLNDASIMKGTYSFKVRPIIKYGEDGPKEKLNYITFKVKVDSTQPKVKVKSSTLTLNTYAPGNEMVATTYSITNLPAGTAYTIDGSAAYLVPVKSNYKAEDKLEDINVTFEGNNTISVQLDENTKREKFDYDYYVRGLKLQVDGETSACTLDDFKIKIKGNYKQPGVTIRAKGTLNPVVASDGVMYTTKVNNIVSDVASVSIRELNLADGRNEYYEDENNRPISKHFEPVWDAATQTVTVKAKDGVALKSGVTYKIQLVFGLSAVSDKQYVTGDLAIKPKQTLPKIKTDKSSAYLYAGQNRAKEVTVQITKTSVTDANIIGVKFGAKTSQAVKDAYDIRYDESTGKMTLKLVNPAKLVLNQKNTITFETVCENQMENSTGTTFKLDVTVRK